MVPTLCLLKVLIFSCKVFLVIDMKHEEVFIFFNTNWRRYKGLLQSFCFKLLMAKSHHYLPVNFSRKTFKSIVFFIFFSR